MLGQICPPSHNQQSLRTCYSAAPNYISLVLWAQWITGEPTGFVMSHTTTLCCIIYVFGRLNPKIVDDVVPRFCSLIFDVSVVDHLAILCLRATRYMKSRAELLTNIREVFEKLKTITASLAPNVARQSCGRQGCRRLNSEFSDRR
jgi:hypothetical protein